MPDRLEAIVSGKVQGVSFRDFVHRKATRLWLLGIVQNLDDGTVQVIAEGEREKLEELLAHLHKGPLRARVTNIFIAWTTAKGEFGTFEISTPSKPS